jgi:hypothetical protein
MIAPVMAGRSRLGVFRSYPELALFALLLLLTATLSRSFSKGVHVGPLYVTEFVMVVAGLGAIARLGVRGAWTALRRLPLAALALIWVVGLIATLRGLRDYSLDFVENDVGLVDYTLILPLLALLAVDRKRYEALFSVLVACGFAGLATFFVVYTSDQISGHSDTLLTLQGSAAGLYMSLAVSWVAARLVNRVPTPWWLIATIPVGLILMGLTSQRSVWMVAILSLGTVAVLAMPPAWRLRAALAAAAMLVVTFVAAAGIQWGIDKTAGGVHGSSENFATSSGGDEDGGGGGGPQLTKELSSLGGGNSDEAENVTWRLAYWEELIKRTPHQPILGAGFGRPAAFTWDGRKYDFRDGEPGTGIDVAGPHNSFVNFLWRLGIPAFLALVFIGFVALRNVVRAMRDEGLSTEDRVRVTTLAAMLAAGTMASAFNEGLTGPFLGLFFWVPLGMLLLWPPPERAGVASS